MKAKWRNHPKTALSWPDPHLPSLLGCEAVLQPSCSRPSDRHPLPACLLATAQGISEAKPLWHLPEFLGGIKSKACPTPQRSTTEKWIWRYRWLIVPKMIMGSGDHGTARTHHLLGWETIWSALALRTIGHVPANTQVCRLDAIPQHACALWHTSERSQQVTINQLCSAEVHRVTFFWDTLSPMFPGLLLACSVLYTTALLQDWAKIYNLVLFFK